MLTNMARGWIIALEYQELELPTPFMTSYNVLSAMLQVNITINGLGIDKLCSCRCFILKSVYRDQYIQV